MRWRGDALWLADSGEGGRGHGHLSSLPHREGAQHGLIEAALCPPELAFRHPGKRPLGTPKRLQRGPAHRLLSMILLAGAREVKASRCTTPYRSTHSCTDATGCPDVYMTGSRLRRVRWAGLVARSTFSRMPPIAW